MISLPHWSRYSSLAPDSRSSRVSSASPWCLLASFARPERWNCGDNVSGSQRRVATHKKHGSTGWEIDQIEHRTGLLRLLHRQLARSLYLLSVLDFVSFIGLVAYFGEEISVSTGIARRHTYGVWHLWSAEQLATGVGRNKPPAGGSAAERIRNHPATPKTRLRLSCG